MIARLETRGFRNLADGHAFAPGPGRHLLLGANGAGKTSLLEAAYVVATGRSFRTAQLVDCARHGEGGFFLGADGGAGGRTRLEVGLQGGERVRLCNGAPVTAGEHLAAQPVVVWTRAEGRILEGPPELRRRMLDRGVLAGNPPALAALGRYRRALRHKRELLGTGGRAQLVAWNQVLAEAAAEIVALRAGHAALLQQELWQIFAEIPLDLAAPELVYRPSPPGAAGGPAVILESLDRLASRELERRLPLAGPHRDDLSFRWRDRDVARLASAGEAKALGLLLAAAQTRVVAARGRDPVLLLDDVDTELDRDRLRALWPAFAPFEQVFATSNRPEVWEGVTDPSPWHLREGQAIPGMAP